MIFPIALFRQIPALLLVSILSCSLSAIASASSRESGALEDAYDPSYDSDSQNILIPIHPRPDPPPMNPPNPPTPSQKATSNTLQDLHTALSTMQTLYFSLWLGKWTTAIDWTAAVTGTHISATLSSLSSSIPYTLPGTFDKARKLDVEAQMVENEINKYFGHSVAYYFGEEAFAIRLQAYDDMLWVVLGWLDGIQFIKSHSELHYSSGSGSGSRHQAPWHGQQFTPAFAHRARVFYELASEGWDWELCGGGMTWNPNLNPYKNAITNQLFISASISMYLHFPGDKNCSPFFSAQDGDDPSPCSPTTPTNTSPKYDPIHLAAAINGYAWLKNSGMQNSEGLYVDGFHITGYGKNGSIGTGKCDDRNEMVYTYNQGVVLSGLRGLWEGTGEVEYLEDGHALVRSVIRATGWRDSNITPFVSFSTITAEGNETDSTTNPKDTVKPKAPPKSRSLLGTSGILTELCDPSGTCSQDSQTFKGIFFHHLVHFCTPLPLIPVKPGKTYAAGKEVRMLHRQSCREYTAWVVKNAEAAGRTRDGEGRFGGWWGVGEKEGWEERDGDSDGRLPEGAVDYRNDPELRSAFFASAINLDSYTFSSSSASDSDSDSDTESRNTHPTDPNTRGRGRTVETQGGGVAVLRAMWEFLRWADGDVDDDEAV